MPDARFTDDELEALKAIVCDWVEEGFTTPPYDRVMYALFAKLGIAQSDLTQPYDISPPDPPDVAAVKV